MNTCKKIWNKYGQKRLASAKKLTADTIKTIQPKKTVEKICDLTGNKTADKSTSVSKKYLAILHSQNNEAKDEIETPVERYISQEKI